MVHSSTPHKPSNQNLNGHKAVGFPAGKCFSCSLHLFFFLMSDAKFYRMSSITSQMKMWKFYRSVIWLLVCILEMPFSLANCFKILSWADIERYLILLIGCSYLSATNNLSLQHSVEKALLQSQFDFFCFTYNCLTVWTPTWALHTFESPLKLQTKLVFEHKSSHFPLASCCWSHEKFSRLTLCPLTQASE